MTKQSGRKCIFFYQNTYLLTPLKKLLIWKTDFHMDSRYHLVSNIIDLPRIANSEHWNIIIVIFKLISNSLCNSNLIGKVKTK